MNGTVLHARSRFHFWSGAGALSIKSFYRGHAQYEVGGARYLVDDTRYLLLNGGQDYTVIVDAPTPVESFCLFFATGFAEATAFALTAETGRLLDDPHGRSSELGFFERTYRHDELLSPALAHLHNRFAVHGQETCWVDEQLQQVMTQLLIAQGRVQKEVETLPAARPATRVEIYRRLWRAYDFIAAAYDEPLTLAMIAGVANLSPNHLLRTFRQLFQQTPHQCLVERRLERAQQLLRQSDRSVTEICFAVGFESLGSFSWLFRRRLGLSPEQFRRTTG